MPRPPRQQSRKPSPRSNPQPQAAGWASRLAAAEILHIVDEGADLETALDKSRTFRGLEGPDRGFARAIAGAALRGQGRIDWALGGMLDRPLDQIEPPVRALLRAGCAQLWMLGVADHAAVGATVEAARHWREAQRGGGLINAVLRRAGRERAAFDETPKTAVWPDWLAAKLKSALGAERADALAELQLIEPHTDLTLRSGADQQAWADKLGAEPLSNGSLRLPAGARLTDLPGYAEGDWWVQDAAASLAAKLMGDVTGKAVADLCAAPGGKALQLASMGANLSAVEISRQRLEKLRENIARTGLKMDVVEADARAWRPPEKLDAVLLDAPCSALGVLRRHPEGAWRRDPADLARFPKTQLALIEAAGAMLNPGGRLVYCVCTPTPEEGAGVIASALAAGGWKRIKIASGEIPGFGHALTDDGDVITAPPLRDSDAALPRNIAAEPVESDVFFVSRLERTPV
jgi:16S rRNA (cytosine967-C5)-methyltransferase